MQRRHELLAQVTNAEKSAYNILIGQGYKVIRQQPIDTGRRIYFADLYLPEYRIIVELDGGYHNTKNQKRLDNNRSAGLWRMGYHVLRLANRDAYSKDKVLQKIKTKIK